MCRFLPKYPNSLSNISESIRDSRKISTACKNSDISLSETLCRYRQPLTKVVLFVGFSQNRPSCDAKFVDVLLCMDLTWRWIERIIVYVFHSVNRFHLCQFDDFIQFSKKVMLSEAPPLWRQFSTLAKSDGSGQSVAGSGDCELQLSGRFRSILGSLLHISV